jgi:hypothetical protein
MSSPTLVQTDEDTALDLMRAIRADAAHLCAPDMLALVSVSVDMSGHVGEGVLTLSPRVDRRTRTLLFTGGTAKRGAVTVMTATAIYRIISAAPEKD